jgi:hypothetical protein
VAALDPRRGQRQRAQLLDVRLGQAAGRAFDPDDVDVEQGAA